MMIFQAAHAAKQRGEKFEAISMESARLGTIHQDDLADLFVRVADRVSSSIVLHYSTVSQAHHVLSGAYVRR